MTVQDVILRIGDITGNYSVGQSTNDQKIRAVDYAVNYLKNTIGLPQDTQKYQFYFAGDNNYYDVPSDFQEFQGLFYDIQGNNTTGRAWNYRPDVEVFKRIGDYPGQNTVSLTYTNKPTGQLLLWGENITPIQTLETFDVNLWTASGDASAAATDTTVFYEGNASERFTLGYSTGTGTLTSPAMSLSLQQLFQKFGNLNLYAYFPSTAVTSVALKLLTDTGNYWTITQTAQASGAPWTLNQWNKLTFPTSSAVQTGTPSASNITQIQIVFTIPNTFGTVQNFRVDDLYMVFPDLLDLIYLSNYKGTSQTGSKISILSNLSDTLNYAQDFIEPISVIAAEYIFPQLRADLNWMQFFGGKNQKILSAWARRFPKRRTQNDFTRTTIQR